MIKTFFTILFAITTSLTATAQTFNFDFTSDYEGWIADYADYPVLSAADSMALYELVNGHSALPATIVPTDSGIMIQGDNHSDDLFMFLKKKVTGLQPNTAYTVYYNIDIASNAPTNANGVGGAPGEGVTLKAGVTLVEPVKQIVAGYYLMNIDKANQANPGPDMDTLGNMGVSDTTTVYHLIQRNNNTHPFHFTSDQTGEAWLIVGTESGFEATTRIYYGNINVQFVNPLALASYQTSGDINIYPNPVSGNVYFKAAAYDKIISYSITDVTGRTVRNGPFTQTIDLQELNTGIYCIMLHTDNGIITKRVIKQ